MSLDRLRPSIAALAGGLLALLSLLALGVGPAAAPAHAADALTGTFRLSPGRCDGGATGSYFRMILPSGTTSGPWIDNADSTCADRTYTLFTPGTDGGLVTGGYQPAPSPGFDGDGNSLAAKIIRPVRFFGVDFSLSTNPIDLQTNGKTSTPVVQADGGKLSGDLSAFAATWNKQAFNQGSPKPGGSRPGLTSPVSGSYNAATHAYSLTWTSQIVGGPFNNFTGLWHLEGTFVPAGSGSAAPSGTTATTKAATAAAAASDGGTGTTVAAGEVASPAAPATPAAPTKSQNAASVRVDDDGFEAPVWLVVGLAAIGIAGVISLLVLGRRPHLEGTLTTS
jgi:hypothetical protein